MCLHISIYAFPFGNCISVFYDALRDLGAERAGLRPVVHIFEEDVLWEKEGAASSPEAKTILDRIEKIVGQKRGAPLQYRLSVANKGLSGEKRWSKQRGG